MNLLFRGGYRSIRQGLLELAYDIKGILALGGVQLAGAITEWLLGSPASAVPCGFDVSPSLVQAQ
jgi:hypothetical protein